MSGPAYSILNYEDPKGCIPVKTDMDMDAYRVQLARQIGQYWSEYPEFQQHPFLVLLEIENSTLINYYPVDGLADSDEKKRFYELIIKAFPDFVVPPVPNEFSNEKIQLEMSDFGIEWHMNHQGITTVTQSKETDKAFQKWIPQVERTIKKHWHPPQTLYEQHGRIRMLVNREGRIYKYRLVASTCDRKADDAILEAVKEASQKNLPPLPETFVGRSVTVEYVFDYDIHHPWKN